MNNLSLNNNPLSFKKWAPEKHNQETATNIVNMINNADSIAIIGHRSPDGDDMGACLGLNEILESKGKKVHVFIDNLLPGSFNFMKDKNKVISPRNNKESKFDLAIVLDTANKRLLGASQNLLKKADKIIKIDHHAPSKDTEDMGNINFVDNTVSSASQLVMQLTKPLGFKPTKNYSNNLLTGLLADTNTFSFSKEVSFDLNDAKLLQQKGANFKQVKDSINLLSKEETLKKSELMNQTKFINNDTVSYLLIDRTKPENQNISKETVNQYFFDLDKIENVETKIIVNKNGPDRGDVIQVRSKKTDLTPVFEKYGGGGHKTAGGIFFKEKLTKEKVKEVVNDVKTEVNKNK